MFGPQEIFYELHLGLGDVPQAESASLNSATGPPYLDKMPAVVGHLGHIWPTQHSF